MHVSLVKNASYAIALLLLAGCVSGYQSFYKPNDVATPEAFAANRVAPAPATPLLERSAPADLDTVEIAYAKRGYAVIGYSAFNSDGHESETAAVKQGQSVGADLVLVFDPKYTGSVTSNIALTSPTTTTSYTTGSATAVGAGGRVTAYGNATTTTTGSKTTYVPITAHYSNFGAVYFVKQRFNFGAITRDLSDSERQELQTNQGGVVTIIVDDTPAFRADVLPGDIIAAIDGVNVPNSDGFTRMLRERKGKSIIVTLVRKGQRIDKVVQLNQ